MPGVAPTLTYEVYIDWNMTDWADTPDFSQAIDNITADVQSISLRRGKETEQGNAPASTLDIEIKPGIVAKYSPANVAGPLFGLLLPWRITRVRIYAGGVWYDFFLGFISRISLKPHLGRQRVYLYCTDGLDLLARQIITQNYDDRVQMSDGEAVGNLLDVAGWSAIRRNIDTDGGSELLNYPNSYEY